MKPRNVLANGMRIGRLVIVETAGRINRELSYMCRCDCGKITTKTGGVLIRETVRSCGCLRRQTAAQLKLSHGACHTREYQAYSKAKSRCVNPDHPRFADYGGRGIQFNFHSFEEFIAEIGPRPSNVHSLDRRDNNGHYETGNVRWATRSEQRRNQRDRHAVV